MDGDPGSCIVSPNIIYVKAQRTLPVMLALLNRACFQ